MRHFQNERGATMLEFALILPVLLTVMFGIMESGRLMSTYVALAGAARAGTRYAIVHGSDRMGTGADGPSGAGNTSNVVTVVKNITSAGGLSGSVSVDVEYPYGNAIGDPVTVTVSYPFNAVVLPLIPLTVTLGSTSQGTICY